MEWLVRYIDKDSDRSMEVIVEAKDKEKAEKIVKKKRWCYRVIEVKENK